MIVAHAFGQRYELPIPLLIFVLGGAAVVLVSFMLIATRTVSPDTTKPSLDVPTLGSLRVAPGSLATVVLAALVICGFGGSQVVAENILPTLFWLIVWIAVPLSVGVLGDWTRPVNPFAFLSRVAGRPGLRKALLGTETPVTWPAWLGWWPAVLLFFVTACGELVFNLTATVPRVTALALTIYALLSVFAGFLFGQRWLERGEMFTVLYSTWGRLGYFRFGSPGPRRFAGGLVVPFEATWSRVSFVLLLLVSVNFDGLLATPRWTAFERTIPGALLANPGRLEAFRTSVFLVLAASLAVLFGLFAYAATRIGRQQTSFRSGLAGLLPSLLPIAFAYLLAHNIEYLVVNSQLLLPLLGNPAGVAWWLRLPFPFNDSYEVHPHLFPNGVYWYVSVVVIVVAHVVAVVLAHHHLGAHEPDPQLARAREYPWLAVMVAYTMLSLWLLAQPLVTEHRTTTAQDSTRPPSSGVAQQTVMHR
jgi:hypothetical protein